MTAASRSIYYFGFYLILTGITLTVFPNMLLGMFGFPETTEVWIRVLGIVVFNMGLAYIVVAPSNNTLFLTFTVFARAAVFAWFLIFYFINLAPAQLIIFGVIDLAGAAWTYSALRKGS
jgi:hypothetical protein